MCRAKPPHDKRECELPAGHPGKHQISGVITDKFGAHAWKLTWGRS